jgi:hypothetical protein
VCITVYRPGAVYDYIHMTTRPTPVEDMGTFPQCSVQYSTCRSYRHTFVVTNLRTRCPHPTPLAIIMGQPSPVSGIIGHGNGGISESGQACTGSIASRRSSTLSLACRSAYGVCDYCLLCTPYILSISLRVRTSANSNASRLVAGKRKARHAV